jgi:hemoglobin
MSLAPVQATPFIPFPLAETSGQSLYERIGGMQTIRRVVDELCVRALGDVKLRNWVRQTAPDPAKLGAYKRMFTEFVAGLAGGPTCYSGDDLASAHKGLGISALDFDRFFVYFLQSVYEIELPQPARSELLEAFAMTKQEIVERW